ncbi:MAG: ABC transporter permease subunit [Planctomycetota bacterium]
MHSIWAVATNTIKQAVRMKVAAVFLILLLVLLPVMGFSATGDGTLKGRLQTFVSYGLSLTSILLCLLTIIISIYSVTSDIEQRQIYTVITKPIRRSQFLLGKLLGVVLLDVILLSLFAAIIYTITIYTPQFFNATETERIQANNEFFTARAALAVPALDVSQEVKDRYEQLERSRELPEGISYKEIIAELAMQQQLAKRAADVGQVLVWEFDNVKPLAQSMFIKFKYDVAVNPPDMQVYGRWFAGDYQYIRYGTESKTPVYDRIHKHSVRNFHEIEVPADVVPEHGHLAVAFQNAPLNNTVIIFPPDGIEVLYKADTFTGNFVRAVLLILSRLIFLACLGILASTFLSFPVAILLCLFLFSTASVSGFVIESFSYLSENISVIYSYTIKWIIQLLPQFDKFNPTIFLVPARLLSWSLLARCAGVMVCIKAFLLLVIALVIFSYREIAKIIV